ncbi:MAG: transcription termination factor NusA [Chitinophagales bacterium]
MNSIELIDSFAEFKDFKNIDRPTMMRVLEDVFKTIIRKKYGSDDNFDVIVNTDKGDLEIWRTREIVDNGEVENDLEQIAIKDAVLIDEDYEIGEDCYDQMFIDDFGRRAVLAARQTLISRILDLEKDEVYKKYKDRVGDIISGEVYQVWKKEILLLDDDGNELLLPKSEQIRQDYFKKGETVRAIIKKVEFKNNNPFIILSRTDSSFLAKLLELEVPEIFDGLILIKNIVREPGEKAKVAVESYDDRIDPVGACVGVKGSRIHGIVRELKNENIDILNFTENLSLMTARALSPAKVERMNINEEDKKIDVYLKPDQVSLAIGKRGLNIKLASKMVGYEIDVYRDEDVEEVDDILLSEFSDEIEQWMIDELYKIGCDTAKNVLNLDAAELVRRTELEEENVADIMAILKAEFEDEAE